MRIRERVHAEESFVGLEGNLGTWGRVCERRVFRRFEGIVAEGWRRKKRGKMAILR